MSDDALLAALRDLLGASYVITDSVDLDGRNHDGRGSIGCAAALVRPSSAEQVSAVMRLAFRHDVRIVVQGARTGLVGGGTADESGRMIVLGVDRLNRPPEIDVVNRSATVDAGVLLSSLNAAAGSHGLTFPIDLGADPSVGGMISANTGGARFLRYGDVRRNLLGLHVVLADADGTRIDLGSSLWKDNSGLDLKQMLVGAGGSLGIVTHATVALQPMPATSLSAMIALRQPSAAETLLGVLECACGTLLTAFEGMSPAAYEAALTHVTRLRRPFDTDCGAYYLLIELSAGAGLTVEQLEEILATALDPFIGDDRAIIDIALDGRGSLWDIRHAIPDALRAKGQVIGCDIALRRGDVSRFRETIGAELAREFPGLELCDFGHVGDGGLHFNMVWRRDAGPPPVGLADRARAHVLTAAVERFDGTFSAEHGIGPRNIDCYRRWTPPDEQALAGRVQAAYAAFTIGRMKFGPISEGAPHA